MLKFALNIAMKLILLCPHNLYLKLLLTLDEILRHFTKNNTKLNADDFRFKVAMLTW